MAEALGDPVDVLLDRTDHVGQHRRAARTGDHEQVGKARCHEAQVGARAVGPLVGQPSAAAGVDIHAEQRTGDRIEAGGQHDRVEFVGLLRCLDAVLGDGFDRIVAHVHQGHVVAVVGLEVVGIEADPLGADEVVVRRECVGHRRIAHDRTDLGPHELGSGVIGAPVGEQVLVEPREAGAAAMPAGLISARAFIICVVKGAFGGQRDTGNAGRGHSRARPHLAIAGLELRHLVAAQRAVVGGQAVVGRALKHVQMRRLAGDLGDGLNTRRTGADDTDPLAAEVHAFLGPQAGVIQRPLEAIAAGELRQAWQRQAAHCHDAKPCHRHLAAVGAYRPLVGRLIEARARDPGIEDNVAAQIEAVGDMVGIAEDFGLGRVALFPDPGLLQGFRERVGVLQAFDIAARARVTIPVPGAAHAAAGLEHPYPHAERA